MTTQFDYQRVERLGMSEAVLCEGKHIEFLQGILEELQSQPDHPVLFTRLSGDNYSALGDQYHQSLDYDPISRTAILHGGLKPRNGKVAIVTAGTSDLDVATEAARTLQFSGIEHKIFADVGVAGIWRLLECVDEIASYDAVIAVAGMDAALASVLSGLVGKCIIGVPTSVGYGVAQDGTTALNSMLASCGQGLLVTNIDNGFGAASAAIRILNTLPGGQQ